MKVDRSKVNLWSTIKNHTFNKEEVRRLINDTDTTEPRRPENNPHKGIRAKHNQKSKST